MTKEEHKIILKDGIQHSFICHKNLNDFSFFDQVVLNENTPYKKEILKGGYLVLIPLKDSILLNLNGFKWRIEQNQTFVYYMDIHQFFEIESNEEGNSSEFILFFILQPFKKLTHSIVPKHVLNDNKWNRLIATEYFDVFIGKYHCNKKDELSLKRNENSWMLSSIKGGFVVENLYLEEANSLVMKQCPILKYSSLSEASILLAIDYKSNESV